MNCPRCEADAPSDAEFCPQCGAKLIVACAQCETGNAPQHRVVQEVRPAAGRSLESAGVYWMEAMSWGSSPTMCKERRSGQRRNQAFTG
jgi:double zinc ribbon protein